MDIKPQTTKPISDDQELAKVLDNVTQDANNLDFEETPSSLPAVSPTPTDPPADTLPIMNVTNGALPTVNGYSSTSSNYGSGDLEDIKKSALTELRPLVDKLDLEPQEKFDTLLLLLRSTDDKTLVQPAYTAAQAITDETKRAQALLDVIKEIDYFSAPTAA